MRTSHSYSELRRYREGGIVLITGLIFMVVLTLVVLALMRGATLEERMASNARDRQLALQAAEAVLRDARDTLLPFTCTLDPCDPVEPFNRAGFTNGTCTNGFCQNPPALLQQSDSWWTDNAITRTFAVPANSVLSGVASPPRFVVEFLKCEPKGATWTVLFRVTARGVGRDSAKVFLESTVRYQPTNFVGGTCI